MSYRPLPFFILALASISGSVFAQNNILYSHYYLNPSLYNPSFTGANGYTELFLNFRKQWVGVDGAPTTGTLNFHHPFSYKTSIGLLASQDQAGIIRTSTGLATFAYSVYFGKKVEDIHRLTFGVGAGVTNTFLDGSDNPDDPANSTSTYFNGQFGLNYQLKGFDLSFSIPNLFKTYVATDASFVEPGIDALKSTVSSVSYRISLNSVSIEPFFIFRTTELDNQYEALGVVRYKNFVWLGGGYRQDYGASGFIGFAVKEKLKIGYAYELSTNEISGYNDGTHEIQIVLRVGKEHVTRPQPKTEPEPVAQTEPTKIEEKPEEKLVVPSVVDVIRDSVVVAPQVEVKPEEPRQEVIKQETEKPRTLDGKDLAPGHYVVVGVFKFSTNASKYMQTLKLAGYPADMAFVPAKNYYIVHMGTETDLERAKQMRDKYRQMSRYSLMDTWILSIE